MRSAATCPFLQEEVVALLDRVHIEKFRDHHVPADHRHDPEDPDDDPAVDGDRLEDDAEEAEAAAEPARRRRFVLADGDDLAASRRSVPMRRT